MGFLEVKIVGAAAFMHNNVPVIAYVLYMVYIIFNDISYLSVYISDPIFIILYSI